MHPKRHDNMRRRWRLALTAAIVWIWELWEANHDYRYCCSKVKLWCLVGGPNLRDVSPINTALHAQPWKRLEQLELERANAKTALQQRKKVSQQTDDVRLRYSLAGILQRQEDLRSVDAVPTRKAFFAIASAMALAAVTCAGGMLPAWYFSLIPMGSSVLFLKTSEMESAASRSHATARYNAAKADALTARGELLLAEAEVEKAFVPFGAGLTAIAAAACVAIKVFNEKMGDLFGDQKFAFTDIFEKDDLLLIFLAFVAVMGTVITNDQGFKMRSIIRLYTDRDASIGDSDYDVQNFIGQRTFPSRDRQYNLRERATACAINVAFSVLPVVFVSRDVDTLSLIQAGAVLISASAGLQAAVAFVSIEKDFADVERQVSAQGRQAALAELFYAQTAEEVAILPVATACSGAVLGGAAFAVEISRLMAMVVPWPAAVASIRASLGSALAKLQSKSTWLEKLRSTRSIKELGALDSVSALTREAARLQRQFDADEFREEVRSQIEVLSQGEQLTFRGLSRNQRRKVYLAAAELGFASQPASDLRDTGFLRVKNLGFPLDDLKQGKNWAADLFAAAQEEFNAFGEGFEADNLLPLYSAILVVGGSLTSAVFTKKAVAALVLPLATGSVGLITTWQELVGTEQAAKAKGYAAAIAQIRSEAEAVVGRTMAANSVFPMILGVSTCACFLSVVGLSVDSPILRCMTTVPALPIAALAYGVGVRRLFRTEKLAEKVVGLIDGELTCRAFTSTWALWVVVACVAFVVPVDMARKIALACAAMMVGSAHALCTGGMQVANAQVCVARATNICASGAGWAQQASRATRLLPFETAVAVITTLLCTSCSVLSPAAATVFPAVGLVACARALQLSGSSTKGANQATISSKSLQRRLADSPFDSDNGEDAQAGRPERRSLIRRFLVSNFVRRSVERSDQTVVLFDEAAPEDEYERDPANVFTEAVVTDMEELYATRRDQQANFRATLTTLALISLGALLAPVLLSELATEVLLPTIGAGLTLFTVAEESEARRQVAEAKMRASELDASTSRMELIAGQLATPRGHLVVLTAFTAAIAVALAVLEHPFHQGTISARSVNLLVTLQALSAAVCVHPLWKLFRISRDAINPAATLREGRRSRILKRIAFLASVLPTWLFFALPPGRPFINRAVVSTAVAAFQVALVMVIAEVQCSRTERAIAARIRAFALTDAFSHEAEQQGAVLPFVSGCAIALSAAITFTVELNPGLAALFTILQTATWVLATKKGLTAKFESSAAVQVDSVSRRRESYIF